MGCSTSDSNPNEEKPKSKSVLKSLKTNQNFAKSKPTLDKLNTFLGNKELHRYNESAQKVTKYWKDQKPPDDKDTPYVDDLFPPDNNSLFSRDKDGNPTDPIEGRPKVLNVNEDEIIWLRVDEIFPVKYCVFQEKIEFDDVIQGSLSNCYF